MLGFVPLGTLPIATVPSSSDGGVEAEVASYGITFAELNNPNLLDWTSSNYSSTLDTYYIVPEDAMTWMQSPYIYVFLKGGDQQSVISEEEFVVDSNDIQVVSSSASCVMNAIWDWSNTVSSNIVIVSSDDLVIDSTGDLVIDDLESAKSGRDIQVYKDRDGIAVALSKNKIRGRGKVLKLRFRSEEGKSFNLLGWAAMISKAVRY